MFRIKCDLQIRGNDWGVSIGAGRIVGADEDLGDGKTLSELVADGCVADDHYEAVEPPAAAPIADVDDHEG
jgi:hypothetical protein